MSEQQQDARHEATPIRLQQATREGNVPRSHELAAAIQLTAGVGAVWFALKTLSTGLLQVTHSGWSTGLMNYSQSEFVEQAGAATSAIAMPLAGTLVVLLLISVFSHVIQSGSATISSRSMFRTDFLNPATGLARLFSLQNLTRGVIGIPKILVVVAVAGAVAWSYRYAIFELPQRELLPLVSSLSQLLFGILFSAAATLLAISVFDYATEWFSYFRRMRMTDQQLRDEQSMQGPDAQLLAQRQRFYQEL